MTSDLIYRITDLERSYLDHNETVQKIDKRIWAIAARLRGSNEDGKLDKVAIGRDQKAVKAGKCDNPVLVMLTADLVSARNMLEARQNAVADEMIELAKGLPCYEWFTAHRGLKDLLFARLIANIGNDLAKFDHPAKLWKRFGLDVVDGKAPKAQRGVQLTYAPRRKAFALGVIGTNLMMQNPRWKAVYDWRKQYERDRAVEKGLKIRPSASITPKNRAESMSDGHIHARARRYMVKQFLRAFWEEWTGDTAGDLPAFIREAA